MRMFDGGADLAQRGVELDLAGAEVDAGESLVPDGVDSLDADVAQIGHRGVAGEHLGQPGRGEGVPVVAGAVHRDRADRGELAVAGGRDYGSGGWRFESPQAPPNHVSAAFKASNRAEGASVNK